MYMDGLLPVLNQVYFIEVNHVHTVTQLVIVFGIMIMMMQQMYKNSKKEFKKLANSLSTKAEIDFLMYLTLEGVSGQSKYKKGKICFYHQPELNDL